MPGFRIFDNKHRIYVIVTYRDETLLSLELKRNATKSGINKDIGEPKSRFEREIAKDLRNYFAGKEVSFDYNLSFDGLTPFQKKVLAQLKKIPYSSVASYKSVALKTGNPKAFRAVGSACGKNPFPIIIPCHRVVKTDGSLGGFGSGIDIKQELLNIEGINYANIKTILTRNKRKK